MKREERPVGSPNTDTASQLNSIKNPKHARSNDSYRNNFIGAEPGIAVSLYTSHRLERPPLIHPSKMFTGARKKESFRFTGILSSDTTFPQINRIGSEAQRNSKVYSLPESEGVVLKHMTRHREGRWSVRGTLIKTALKALVGVFVKNRTSSRLNHWHSMLRTPLFDKDFVQCLVFKVIEETKFRPMVEKAACGIQI
ncbi:hypothetical protein QJS04_geneDACA024290 [Acorus gramineus]|uniref:Uncharacterized protein n=1 Tax=Acorus gramineus TaxID=55184 RepID=A0AAV9A3E4_ACOGR|nr:hypothetical protein QJS04_geneDACA024290 [Acorus gramineus]